MNNLLKQAVVFYATITPHIDAAIMACDDARYQRLARISTRASNRISRRAKLSFGRV